MIDEGDIMSKINRVASVNGNNTYSVNSTNGTSSTDFESYLGESQSLDQIFDKAADKYNVPVELLKSVAKAESNFRANAVSRCGAQGIMQLMPSTAKGLGVTNSFDPEQNIMGGAKYISGLLKRYDGNTSLALAAYNAGSGNVAKYGGIPPFKETQNYVKKILGYMQKCGKDAVSNDTSTVASKANNALHVAFVAQPAPIQNNYAYLLTNNLSSSDSSADDLDSLFSYDDYMKFLDLFLNDMDDKEAEENMKEISAQDINYNAPVLNLLSEQTGL